MTCLQITYVCAVTSLPQVKIYQSTNQSINQQIKSVSMQIDYRGIMQLQSNKIL